MKWSIYNEIINNVEDKEVIYLFNSLRKKYFTLDYNLTDLVQAGRNNTLIIANSHPELYEYLMSEKFIVPDDIDEVAECIQMINRKFLSDVELKITINPTLDCNLKCWYCYENHIKGSCMDASTIEAIIKYIEIQAHSNTLKKIYLSFFGGEPLLKYSQVIKPIAKQCSEICNRYNKMIMLSFTTNGVCLSPAIVNELMRLSPEVSVQVAFDGNRDFHDSVKCFENGKGCYDLVKKQLFYAINKGIMTTIRCNYTSKNIESFQELIDDFKQFWHYPNVKFSFHKVWQEPESDELIAKKELLKQYILRSGIRNNINSFYGEGLIPCYADYDNYIVVNYNGDIYKCTARDFIPEHRLGHLENTGEIIYNTNAIKRKEKRLTRECFNCRLLPICTICFQQRSESINGTCPYPDSRKNAKIQIKRYFYDVLTLNERRNMQDRKLEAYRNELS
ncbi:MAG: radical SAM protein [Prevotella sp.]|nr:radical SAM protein [Prevotella sp.]